MTARALCLITTAALVGCVSVADVDVTKYEPTCARTCSVAHSQCVASPMSGGTIHRQCKESLILCLQTCPPR